MYEKDGGRKRQIAVHATGLVLAVVIIAAPVQDRDAARPLLWNLSRCCTRKRASTDCLQRVSCRNRSTCLQCG